MPVGHSHRLRSISIVGGFLDGTHFDLAKGLNCLIGARGTGKTSVLELVRFALDALPGRDADPGERKRIESLIEQNLAGGRVQVAIETKEGLSYVASRSAEEQPIVLTGDGKPTKVTFRSGGVFQADIYSQNEVERIADRAQSQLVLIDRFKLDEIAAVDAEIRKVELKLATSVAQITPLLEKQASLTEDTSTLPSVEEKLKKFKAPGKGTPDAIDQAHAAKALREQERAGLEAVGRFLAEYSESLESHRGRTLEHVRGQLTPDILAGPNQVKLKEVTDSLRACGQEIDRLLERACDRLESERQSFSTKQARLADLHDEQELAFRSLIEKHKQVQGQAAERSRLEKLRNDLLAKQRLRDELTQKLDKMFAERRALLHQLSDLRDQRFAVRQQVAKTINDELSPTIQVSVKQYGNRDQYQRSLEDALKGARLKQGRVAEKLASALSPVELSEAIKSKDVDTIIDQAELSKDQAEKVIAALNDPAQLFQLEIVELHDLPKIELRDGESYKDLSVLSKGQKCTAILPILLMDSERPLLVDQPEDNLDNRFVYETVVESILKTKKRRQLVFVTHNPNIPVLGDAERVFALESDGMTARIAKEGTVDECKKQIVLLLEGGEEAFKARKRYAY